MLTRATEKVPVATSYVAASVTPSPLKSPGAGVKPGPPNPEASVGPKLDVMARHVPVAAS